MTYKIDKIADILKTIKKRKRFTWAELLRDLNSKGHVMSQATLSQILAGRRATIAQAKAVQEIFKIKILY